MVESLEKVSVLRRHCFGTLSCPTVGMLRVLCQKQMLLGRCTYWIQIGADIPKEVVGVVKSAMEAVAGAGKNGIRKFSL
jgi:hypothetical protein